MCGCIDIATIKNDIKPLHGYFPHILNLMDIPRRGAHGFWHSLVPCWATIHLSEKHGCLQSRIHSFQKDWPGPLSVPRALLDAENKMMNKTGISPGLQKLMAWRRNRHWLWDFCLVALKARKPFFRVQTQRHCLRPPAGMLLGWLASPLCPFSSPGLRLPVYGRSDNSLSRRLSPIGRWGSIPLTVSFLAPQRELCPFC